MEELATIFNNVGMLVAALAGGISLVMFGFAGIQYMTAQGDPQGMSKAKMSVIGAVVGLAIAGPGVRPCPGSSAVSSLSRRAVRTWLATVLETTATSSSKTNWFSNGERPPQAG